MDLKLLFSVEFTTLIHQWKAKNLLHTKSVNISLILKCVLSLTTQSLYKFCKKHDENFIVYIVLNLPHFLAFH